MNRRKFLGSSAALLAGGCIAPRIVTGKTNPLHLNSLRVAAVGIGGRGQRLISAVKEATNAEIVAYADVDEKILNSTDKDNSKVNRVSDFRRLLDRKDVDAVISATPNHWHALVTVLACQAGKHVYIEKPISHNMFESDAIVAAAERHKIIVQAGFQNRSDTGVYPFFDRLHEGEFGEVTSVHGTCHRPRKTIGKQQAALVVPKHIDYELWLGPAAEQPIYRPRLHYDWHWDFNTGNGDVGNQGPHEWDLMNWALGDTDQLPSSIKAAGNRFGWNDAGDTPNVMAVSGVMNKKPFFFEVMDLKPGVEPPYGRGVGVIVETEKGRYVGGRGGGSFTWNDGKVESFERNGNQDGTSSHVENFVEAVFAVDRRKLRSDCKVGAKSSSMAHMANISFQLGKKMARKDVENSFASNSAEEKLIGRLAKAPEIYHRKHGGTAVDWVAGPTLTFDDSARLFTGSQADQANAKMKRDYRKGFEVRS